MPDKREVPPATLARSAGGAAATVLLFCLLEDKFFFSHNDRIGGNSLVNQAPAPTITLSPIVTLFKIVALVATQQFLPILICPILNSVGKA